MNELMFSLNATLPVFLLIVLGMLLRRFGMFSESFVREADRFNFKITLPVLLFLDIASADMAKDFRVDFMFFCMGATVASFLIVWGVGRLCVKDAASRGTFAMVGFRGSIAVLGVAFVTNLYGDAGIAPLMIASAVPLYNIFSVIALTPTKESGEGGIRIGRMVKDIVTNPLILAVLVAAPFAIFKVEIPSIPMKVLQNLKNIATPLALLMLGAGIERKQMKEKLGVSLLASLFKLVILPGLLVPVAVLCGFRGAELVAITVMLSAPTTVACYIMARNMDSDGALASTTVMLTTLGSSVTITVVVFVLKSLGLI